jgi:two-component system, LytTR family, sensor kinase
MIFQNIQTKISMKKIIEPIIHAILWVAGFLLLLYGTNTLGVFHKTDGTLLLPFLVGTCLNIMAFYAVSVYLIPRFSIKKNAPVLVFQVVVILLIITTVESLIDFLFFSAKYSTADEPFGSQMVVNTVSNFIIILLAVTYGFTRNWLKNERLKQKLKEEKLSAELKFLKAQINPHFLFNVLNMAYSSATSKGDETTANIIERLSGLMRYMLYDSNSEKVEVEKEINYLQDYISLQKQRLSDDTPVDISFEAKGDLATNTIAPLILVPFVENGFKHGIKLEKESFIHIQLNIENQVLHFRAENSNFKIDNHARNEHSGIGLENVRKRLAILYPNQHHLSITDESERFIVDLKITLNKPA